MNEELTMQERIRLNKIRMQNEHIKQKIKQEKEMTKEVLLTAFVGVFIVLVSIALINTQYRQAVSKCSQKHDISYCERKLK